MTPEKLLDEDIVEISKKVLHLVSGQWTEDVALVARNTIQWGVENLYLCR